MGEEVSVLGQSVLLPVGALGGGGGMARLPYIEDVPEHLEIDWEEDA